MADNKKRDDLVIDLGEKQGFNSPMRSPMIDHPRTPGIAPPQMPAAVSNNPIFPVLSYCASSIMMTVTNKFVLSGTGFNLNFFLLCVQVSGKQGAKGRNGADGWAVGCLRDCDSGLQKLWHHTIPRLQCR